MLLMANLPAAGRAVGISPRGDAIVVGLSSGALQVHDPDSLDVSSLPHARLDNASEAARHRCFRYE
jgi:hypothetical protein